jgi:Spy/CpxP family protein refolding chaperone
MTLCLTVLIATAQNEQPKEKATPEQKAQKMTERMTANLKLIPDQVSRVTPINLQLVQKRSELRKSDIKGKDRKAKMDELETEYYAQLSTVLTPEQLDTHKKNVAEMKEKRKEKKKKKKD